LLPVNPYREMEAACGSPPWNAYGAVRNQDPGVPDGVLLDAPEQARLWLAKGSQFAFGLTLLAADRQAAGSLCDQWVDGLRQVGRRAGRAKTALAGNFEIEQVEDLVAAASHRPGYGLQAMPEEIVQGELERVAGATELTLRFLTPLRAHRSKKTQRDGHRLFDRERFEPRAFVQRLAARLAGLGLDAWTEEQLAARAVSDNRLIWLDVSYGPRQSRTALGGAVGRFRVDIPKADGGYRAQFPAVWTGPCSGACWKKSAPPWICSWKSPRWPNPRKSFGLAEPDVSSGR
jgi:hypothetical protein